MRQEALLLKEELEANKVQLETNVSQEIPKDDLKVNEENTVADNKIEQKADDSFLKLINVAKIKGSLYKKYLDSITSINISNPSNLLQLDSFTSINLDGATSIQLDLVNQVAYVASRLVDSITSIDISNPSALFELDSFTFYEKWRSREDLDLHFGEPHFKEFAEKVPDLIVGEPSLVSYEIASETEIT